MYKIFSIVDASYLQSFYRLKYDLDDARNFRCIEEQKFQITLDRTIFKSKEEIIKELRSNGSQYKSWYPYSSNTFWTYKDDLVLDSFQELKEFCLKWFNKKFIAYFIENQFKDSISNYANPTIDYPLECFEIHEILDGKIVSTALINIFF